MMPRDIDQRIEDQCAQNSTFVAWQTQQQDSALQNDTTCKLESALASDTDGPGVVRFDTIAQRVEATRQLARIAGISDQDLKMLLQPCPERLAPFRFAKLFGIKMRADKAFVLDHLCKLDSIEAKSALAALGIVDWPIATRRVRAVCMLRALIVAGRR